MPIRFRMGAVLTPELLQTLSSGRIEFESNKKRGVSVVGDQRHNAFFFGIVIGDHLLEFGMRGRGVENLEYFFCRSKVTLAGKPVCNDIAGINQQGFAAHRKVAFFIQTGKGL